MKLIVNYVSFIIFLSKIMSLNHFHSCICSMNCAILILKNWCIYWLTWSNYCCYCNYM